MGTTNFRRATALTALVVLTAWSGQALANPDPVAIANAVRALEGDHDQAVAAVYVLQAGGERSARQIRDAWPSMSSLGQKRALVALAQLAKEHGAAVDVLIEAARSDDEDIRNRALLILRRSTQQSCLP